MTDVPIQMKVTPTAIPEVLVIEPTVFNDSRGFFYESFNHQNFNESTGLNVNFVQDNHSRSVHGVLRGLHYQIQKPQGKLLRVLLGAVFCVAVDLRRPSITFGKWQGIELSEFNKKQLWVPPGFAHGFLVLTKTADFSYKTTEYYAPQHERCIAWDDPKIGISWPAMINPQLSAKDAAGRALKFADLYC